MRINTRRMPCFRLAEGKPDLYLLVAGVRLQAKPPHGVQKGTRIVPETLGERGDPT
jgi:hypothetical protein